MDNDNRQDETKKDSDLPVEARSVQLTLKQAKRLAWQRGNLKWKLDPNQKEIHALIHSAPRKRYYLNCGRRVGKSYLLAIIGIEFAIKHQNAIIKVAAPTAKMVRQFVLPIYREILKDCPENLRPRFVALDGEWRFPNGSIISIAGCDTQENAESLRGPSCDIFMFDECGFINNLDYIRRNIVGPMLMTTGGRVIYASTPAASPAHDSVTIYHELKKLGCTVTRTIYQNPRLTESQINEFISEESGLLTVDQFKQTVTFRREYMGEFIADSTRAVIPEFDSEKEKEIASIRVPPPPDTADRYVSLDIGFRDGMGMLFGYFDFTKGMLFIQGEELMFRKTTRIVAEKMREWEKKLWDGKKPYLRVSDDDELFIHDMGLEHNITMIPTAKDDKHLQVDNLRRWVTAGKIRIDPSCRSLIHQLSTVIWNERYDSYERNKDGHGDLLDALVYLVRNVRRYRKNLSAEPIQSFDTWMNPYAENKNTGKAILGLFTMKPGIS